MEGTSVRTKAVPRSLLRAPLVLGVISLLTGGSLALLYQISAQRIARIKARDRVEAFVTLLSRRSKPVGASASLSPIEQKELRRIALQAIDNQSAMGLQGKTDSEKGSLHVQDAKDAKDAQPEAVYHVPRILHNPELYILQLSGRGFGGPLELLAAYRRDGSLYHAIMLENAETPGFGRKAENPAYLEMFWDHGASDSSASPASLGNLGPIPTTPQQLREAHLDAVSGSTISFRAIATTLRFGADWLSWQRPHD